MSAEEEMECNTRVAVADLFGSITHLMAHLFHEGDYGKVTLITGHESQQTIVVTFNGSGFTVISNVDNEQMTVTAAVHRYAESETMA